MFRILTKADIVLFAALAVLAGGSLYYSGHAITNDVTSVSGSSQRMVRITVANEEYGEYPLDEDTEITITRRPSDDQVCINIVHIKDSVVWMGESNCKNQVCIQDGYIDSVGQQIICLPNRVVIEIIGDASEREFDAVSQ